MIKSYDYAPGEGTANEIALHPQQWTEQDLLSGNNKHFATVTGFQQFLRCWDFYLDITDLFEAGTERVLDIGVGEGLTSTYLASLGYAVTAIEPSHFLAARTDALARSLGKEIGVHVVSAEHMSLVPEDKFDTAIFHSSLHHCDDPVQALGQARDKLRDGGRLLLVNEPILHCFKSKQRFYRELEESPEMHEHYGGNEHVYRHDEYLEMCKAAGFREVRSEFSKALMTKPRISSGATRRHAALVRSFYFSFRNTAPALGSLYKPLMDRLSLAPRVFIARK